MAVKAKHSTTVAASSSRNVKAKPTVGVVAVTSSTDTNVPPSTKSASPTPRLSPAQRLRGLLALAPASRTICSVEELQAHLKASDGRALKVTLQMKLVWISDHTYKEFKLIRLHFIDAASAEPLQELFELFRDNYESNRDVVNELLLTATMWNTTSLSEDLPPPGAIVTITDCSNLKLFKESDCQATVKLKDLSWQ